jgi:ribonuclease P protein component
MLQARHRFHGRNSLNAVYRYGKTVRGPLITVKYVERQSGKSYRVAVVVSKKVHKSAVTRNRIRRRIYEILRRSDSQFTAGKDLILTVFSDRIAEIDATQLTVMVEDLLRKTTKT